MRSGIDGITGTQPVTGRADIPGRPLRRNDLNGLTAFQRGIQRHHDTVYPGAATAMTDIAVNLIGKIYRCRALWQVNDASLWRQGVYSVIQRG